MFEPSEIEHYCIEHSSPASRILDEIVAYTAANVPGVNMISGPLVAGLLQSLIHGMRATCILDIGAFTGYTAIAMAQALGDEGQVLSYEVSERSHPIAERFIAESGLSNRITLTLGNALDYIPLLGNNSVDLVYLDADKRHTLIYYDALLPKLAPHGLLVVDDVLWSGEVLDPSSHRAKVMAAFNQHVRQDPTVESVIVPLRHGLHIVRKIKHKPQTQQLQS